MKKPLTCNVSILFCGVLKLFLRGANHPRPPCGDGTALDIMQMTVLFVNHIPIVFILCEREWGMCSGERGMCSGEPFFKLVCAQASDGEEVFDEKSSVTSAPRSSATPGKAP